MINLNLIVENNVKLPEISCRLQKKPELLHSGFPEKFC